MRSISLIKNDSLFNFEIRFLGIIEKHLAYISSTLTVPTINIHDTNFSSKFLKSFDKVLTIISDNSNNFTIMLKRDNMPSSISAILSYVYDPSNQSHAMTALSRSKV